jgi:hypothetical protein
MRQLLPALALDNSRFRTEPKRADYRVIDNFVGEVPARRPPTLSTMQFEWPVEPSGEQEPTLQSVSRQILRPL